MNKEIKILLNSKDVQDRVSTLLCALGLVKTKGKVKTVYKYSDLMLTDEGVDIVGKFKEVNDDFVKQVQMFFPKGNRSTFNEVKERANKFFIEYPKYTEAQVIDAAKRFCEEKSLPGYAKYFFFKRDPITRKINSRCLEYLEIVEEDDQIGKSRMI